MKSLIISVILAGIMIAGSLLYTCKIEDVSAEMSEINERITDCLENERYDDAGAAVYELKEFMDKKNTLLATMGGHEDLDKIAMNLAELERYTKERNKADALSKCAVLDFLFKHLTEGYHLKAENIL